MGITKESLNFAQYSSKDRKSATSSIIPTGNTLEHLELFDVSSIYELTLSDFLKMISAQQDIATPESIPHR